MVAGGKLMTIQIRDVPPDLHLAYRLTVTAKGTSIQQQTLRLIEAFVLREKLAPYKPAPK
jgi:hypothetical protein